MKELIPSIAGWIPAIILPLASLMQLVKILRERNVQGISVISWFLFGLANIGLYIFTEKYYAIQSLLGLLGTALVNFTIAILVLKMRKTENEKD
ncbi:MAG: hypothetical protein OEL83_04015 [Desulforhopalus sp.]|nr:hypothetical protein [Desulforhopalus sp.]